MITLMQCDRCKIIVSDRRAEQEHWPTLNDYGDRGTYSLIFCSKSCLEDYIAEQRRKNVTAPVNWIAADVPIYDVGVK